jgi:peptidyl-prolyl cis-trans isomerase C
MKLECRIKAFIILPIFALGMLLTINLCARHELISLCFAAEDFVVATVNGISIMDSELERTISTYKKKAGKREVSPQEKKQLIRNLIKRRLILQQGAAQDLRHEKSIINKVRSYEENLIIAQFLRDEVGSMLKVSEEEIKKYYQENRHKFSLPRRVKARHILLRTQEDAEKVLTRLKAGEDFGQLAKDFSIDLPGALEGGTMGIIEKGTILPELEKVLFTLNKGDFSDIVASKYGFHILTADEIIPASFRSFDEVKEEIKRTIISQKEKEAYESMTARLEEGADIKIFEELLDKEDSSSGGAK